MKPIVKGLAIAAVHVGLVASLGAKLLYDRAMLPRVWVLTAPYDPDLPIRGRYVSLQLVVEPSGTEEAPAPAWKPLSPVVLRVEADRLVAEAVSAAQAGAPSDLHVQHIPRGDGKLTVLDKRVAFFIPEHVADPSRTLPGEDLWVEVTVPKKGLPRPIRLGTKKADGPIKPLQLR
jgi:hypothetical protein